MGRSTQENIFVGILFCLFVGYVLMSLDFGPNARLVPLPISIIGLILVVTQLVRQSFSKTNGARTIKRPKKLSTDTSQSEEAILHVLKETKNFFKTIIFLQATSPLRKRDDIDNAIKTFYKKNYDSLFSCHTAEDYFDIWISKNKTIVPKTINYKKRLPRQLMKTKFYQQNGSIYIFKKEIIEKYNNRL